MVNCKSRSFEIPGQWVAGSEVNFGEEPQVIKQLLSLWSIQYFRANMPPNDQPNIALLGIMVSSRLDKIPFERLAGIFTFKPYPGKSIKIT